MALDVLNKIVFSLLSGFSEFLFVSSPVHQFLYQTITGNREYDAVLMLAAHLGCFAALLVHCSGRLKRFRYERHLAKPVRRRQIRYPDLTVLMDMRIINTAVIPVLLSFLLYRTVQRRFFSFGWILLLLVANGVFLFIPRMLRSGNKDGRSFTMLDGLLMGIGGLLGVLPGFSRLGCMYSVGVMRGADRKYSLDLSLLISIPAVALMLCFDIYDIILPGFSIAGIVPFLGYLLAMAGAFAGAYLSISLIRHLCDRTNAVGFAYYSWGLSVFGFLLYLLVP